jgi:tRNA G37 N-methylase TrmD
VRVHDLRDWTTDRHRTVDDAPYGGGAGMVMRADVWIDAARRVERPGRRGDRGRTGAGEVPTEAFVAGGLAVPARSC